MTQPVYVIGDLHGQVAELERALSLIQSDGGPDAQVVFLGDYVDRGPDSRDLIDHLIAGRYAGRNWITLLGNHDRMFAWFMEDTPRHDPHLLVGYHWLHDRLGGIETLRSYGVEFEGQIRLEDLHRMAKGAVPKSHLTFLRDLALMHQTPELAFVHAGIRPNVPLNEQRASDLVWIRQVFHNHRGPHPKLIVHGHTPVDKATHYGNRVNLDTGAGYGRQVGVAVFEGQTCWELTARGRIPLTP
ncbi:MULTISPECIES: metallophosphoesterase family protein [unclassified Ruegeria]|uniref:metallophosphoesterase family protein n=1 Tax=unclassified Ruegeria TaxID=2625375 RepID=UPI001487C35E|nr:MULTISPECIES: metallophosphoesterase family protein [unclassified Ruegeria]NOD33079.1 serine/threonine protein phosphatase [Ruegeria sp. HKCCD7296]NOD49257.1 serine/threonine protein phosphatase [Ruegeria sp. HKCCD5849]NOD51821.1 serine/threonine protein phosphatase [Ruegeria sp. HKCCD5851]NOD68808.1 serine/threonine protein phosphatase [Ruegeria sp. HKCCD7303]NOE35081.1 serine/threonine protein phosphatase [Ruegeria sp. HKCCD7318]